MLRRTFLTGVAAAALTLPGVLSAQIQGCFGDDGFAAVPCCTPVSQANIPQFPPFQIDGVFGCIKDCELEAQYQVRVTTQHVPVLCDYHVIPLTVVPAVAGAPGYSGVLLAKYARTWVEIGPSGNFDRQVWRFLINADLTPTAGVAPCPQPPVTTLGLRPHFHGHIDYACDVDATGNVVYRMAMSLNHLNACIEHNAFSCTPLPAAIDPGDRSYHLVAPGNFSFGNPGEPVGPIPGESFRSTIFPNPITCLGEGRIRQGNLDTISKNWLCNPANGGTFQWCHQDLTGVVDCGGNSFPFKSLPLGAPLPPVSNGFASLPLGRWIGATGSFPGPRFLTVHWGILDFQDPCNTADIPIQVVQGSSTANIPGLTFTGPVGVPPYDVFMDLQDMVIQSAGVPGAFVPGWGCTFFSKRVFNLNL